MILPSIQISQKDDPKVTSISSSLGVNNVSIAISELPNKYNSKQNVFLLGVDKFRSRKTFLSSEEADYYIGSEISQPDGTFANSYRIEVSFSEATKWFIIYFDTIDNGYPKDVSVGKKKITLNSPILVVSTEDYNKWDAGYIEVKNLNKSNAPLIVRGITTYHDLPYNYIYSIDFSGQDRKDVSLPSWGICTNSGTISVLDSEKVCRQLKNMGATFRIKSFLGSQQTSTFNGTISQIDSTQKTTINLTDILLDWQEQTFKKYLDQIVPYGSTGTRKMSEMLEIINGYATPSVQIESSRIDWGILGDTDLRLSKITIPLPHIIEECSVWNAFTKFCEATGCYIYTDELGQPKIYYDGGR